jgi:hypothetical protein
MRNIPLLKTLQCRAGNDTSCANCGRRLPEARQPAHALAVPPAGKPRSAQKNGRPATKGGSRYDQFKIMPSLQWPATVISAIEDPVFALRRGSLAANYLPASRGVWSSRPTASALNWRGSATELGYDARHARTRGGH